MRTVHRTVQITMRAAVEAALTAIFPESKFGNGSSPTPGTLCRVAVGTRAAHTVPYNAFGACPELGKVFDVVVPPQDLTDPTCLTFTLTCTTSPKHQLTIRWGLLGAGVVGILRSGLSWREQHLAAANPVAEPVAEPVATPIAEQPTAPPKYSYTEVPREVLSVLNELHKLVPGLVATDVTCHGSVVCANVEIQSGTGIEELPEPFAGMADREFVLRAVACPTRGLLSAVLDAKDEGPNYMVYHTEADGPELFALPGNAVDDEY